MTDGQKPITNIRFSPSMAAAARRLAAQDGTSLSAWIRRLVECELSKREGRCVTCGQAIRKEGT